mgnify:CR=1 FL=1
MNRYNIPKYRRNLKKSIVHISGDLVETTMPSIYETATTARDTFVEFKQFMLRGKPSLRQAVASQRKTIFRNANEILSNAKDDLKSGKWYNEDRMFESEMPGMSDLMNNMISDDEDTSTDMSAFNKVLGSTSASGLSESLGNSINETSISNAEYLGEISMNQHSQNIMMKIKHHTETMKSFKNLENIGMSIMEFNTKTFADYMKSTQKYQDAALNELRDIRNIMADQANIISNMSVNKMANRSGVHASENIFNPNGSINIKGLLSNAKNNVSMFNPFGFMNPRDIVTMIKQSPISAMMMLFGENMIPKKTRSGMKSVDSAFNTGMANLFYTMNNWRNDKNISGWRKILGNIIGVDLTKGTKASLATYKNQELNADLEIKKAKAITEVIPSYLSEILRSINGTDKSFNYDTGMFEDNAKIRQSRQKEYTSNISGNMYESNKAISINISKIAKNMSKVNRDLLLDDKNTILTFFVLNIESIKNVKKLSYADCLKMGLPQLNGGKKSFDIIMGSIMAMSQKEFANFIAEAQRTTGYAYSTANSMSMNMATSGHSMAFNNISSDKNMDNLTFAKKDNVNPNHNYINFKNLDGRRTAASYAKKMKNIKSSDDMFKIEEEESYLETKTKDLKNKAKTFIKNKFGNSKIGRFISSRIDSGGDIFEKLSDKIIEYTSEDVINRFIDKNINKEAFKTGINKAKSVAEKKASEVKNNIKNKVPNNTKDVKEVINENVNKTKQKIKGYIKPITSNTIGNNEVNEISETIKNKTSNINNRVQTAVQSVKEKTGINKASEVKNKRKIVGKVSANPVKKGWNLTPVSAENKPYRKKLIKIMKQYNAVAPELYKQYGDKGYPIYYQRLSTGAFEELVINCLSNYNIAYSSYEHIVNSDSCINYIRKSADGYRITSDPYNLFVVSTIIALIKHPEYITKIEQRYKTEHSITDNTTELIAEDLGDGVIGKAKSFVKNSFNKETGDKILSSINSIKDVINPKGKHGKVADTIDKTLSSTKKLFGTGISAGKGALISSLLGMGPMPGIIMGALFGRKKNKSEDTKTKKEAQDTEETVEEQEKELTTMGKFMKRRKYEAVGAAFSSLLGMGPIPGLIVGKLFGNAKYGKKKKEKTKPTKSEENNESSSTTGTIVPGIKKPKSVNKQESASNNKKNKSEDTKTKKEAQDTEETKGSKIGDAVKQFLGNRKNNILGMIGSSLLGMGPIPGLIVSSMYNRRKAAKVRKQGSGIKGLMKKFISNIKNNKASKNISIAAEKMQSATTEEELASAQRTAIIAASMTGGTVAADENSPDTKKGKNLFDIFKDKGKGLKDILGRVAPWVVTIGSMLVGVISKMAKNTLQDIKEEQNIGLGQKNEQGDYNFSDNFLDKGVGISTAGIATSIAGVPTGLSIKASLSGNKALGKFMRGVGADAAGTYAAAQSAKYYSDTAKAYEDRYDTVNATGNKIMSTYRKTQAVLRGTKTGAKLAGVAAGKVGATMTKASAKITAATASGALNGKVGQFIKKIFSHPKIADFLTKYAPKLKNFNFESVFKAVLQRIAKKLGPTALGNLLLKLSDYAHPIGWAIKIARFTMAFLRGANNAAQDLQLDASFDEGLKRLRLLNGLIYLIDEFFLGIPKMVGLTSWLLKFLLKHLPIFGDEYRKKIEESQKTAQEDYEQFLKENDLNREGYTYEMYQSHINPTILGNIKKSFTGDLQAKYKKDGKANKKLKEKYGGYTPITNIDNSSVTNILMNDNGSGAGARGVFSPSNTLRNMSSIIRNSKNVKIHKIKNSKDLEKVMGGSGGRGLSKSTFMNNLSNRLNKGSVGNVYGTTETNNTVESYNSYNEMAKNKPTVFTKFKNGIGKVFKGAKNAVSSAASSAWNGIKSAGSWIKDKVSSGWQWLVSKFGAGARGNDPDYYSQDDPRWANMYFGKYNGHNDTVAEGGCGPTVAAMALQKLTGQKITPNTMAQLAMSTGMKYDNGGTDPKFFNTAGSQFGINFDRSNGLSNSAIRTMASGNPVVLMGKNQSGQSPYGKGTHYILGKGLDKQGNINVLDPQNPRNNKKWKLKDMIKNTAMSITPRGFGRGNEGSTTIPRGACVYFRITSGQFSDYGHVGIYDGNGNVWSALSDPKFAKYVVYSDVSKVPFSVMNSGNLSYLGYGYNGFDVLNDTQADMIMQVVENGTVSGTNHMCQRWVADVYYKALGNRKSADSAQAMWDSMSTKFPGNGETIDTTTTDSTTDTTSTGGNKLTKAISIMNNMFKTKADSALDMITNIFNDEPVNGTNDSDGSSYEFSGNNSVTEGSGKAVSREEAWKRNVTSYTKANVTKKALSAAIEKSKKGAGILKHVDDIIKYSNKYGLDPRFVTSMMIWESGWDTNQGKCKTTNNPLGWKVYGSNNGDTYPSVGEALDTILPQIRDQYVNAGQNSLYGFTHPTDVGASEYHNYTPGKDYLERAETYAKLINNTGGAGARGNTINVSPASLRNNSSVRMVQAAVKNKPVTKSQPVTKPITTTIPQAQNKITGDNLNKVVEALNTIIELLGSIDSSNTNIANKQQSATVVPINQTSPMIQGTSNNKQNILNTIVSGI